MLLTTVSDFVRGRDYCTEKKIITLHNYTYVAQFTSNKIANF